MKIRILVDNNTLGDQRGEWGLSIFIEDEGKKVLLDVGLSDLFIENAKELDIKLEEVDYLVLSHGHADHTWGLPYLVRFFKMKGIPKEERPRLVAHPYAFCSRISPKGKQLDPMMSEYELSRHFNLSLSKEPVWLSDRLVFLGEVERTNDFENKEVFTKVIMPDRVADDYILDDSALVYKAKEGLVIITGCSHSGICNIIEYAKKICKEDRICDILGGFHLMEAKDNVMSATVDYIRKINPSVLHPSHCTGLKAKIELAKVTKVEDYGVGMDLEYQNAD